MKKSKRLSKGVIMRIAREVVVSDKQLKDIAADFNITPQKLSQIKSTKYFQEVCDKIELEYLAEVVRGDN